jgi:hypothetical protein
MKASRTSLVRPIFIVGVPRSGTTLLRAILSAHPAITITPESHFFRFWLPRYRHLNLGNNAQFQQFWLDFAQSQIFDSFGLSSYQLRDRLLTEQPLDFKTVFNDLMQSYAEKQGKRRWGEKTPAHYAHLATILDWYPQAQVLWIVRDPRAVAASLIDKAWASSQVEVHAQTWIDSVCYYDRHWASDPRVLLLQYETLVQDSTSEVRRLCQFLEEDFDPNLLKKVRSPSTLGLDTKPLSSHYQVALSPIHTTSLEKWRSQLSPYQLAIIEHLTREGMNRYHYKPLTDGLSWRRWLQFRLRQQLRDLKLKWRSLKRSPQPILP